ncbi:hypothetical protein TcasGA2_TC012477 [Tribolium castaneum]|uniref:Uncharacterized protein n=1 Tax=Tribolium castaneum TaxID=7070 RepID=D6X2N1_TRICA|nr:hypothetical protein TcasGA2_TC012477 [Tribolium castaneum]
MINYATACTRRQRSILLLLKEQTKSLIRASNRTDFSNSSCYLHGNAEIGMSSRSVRGGRSRTQERRHKAPLKAVLCDVYLSYAYFRFQTVTFTNFTSLCHHPANQTRSKALTRNDEKILTWMLSRNEQICHSHNRPKQRMVSRCLTPRFYYNAASKPHITASFVSSSTACVRAFTKYVNDYETRWTGIFTQRTNRIKSCDSTRHRTRIVFRIVLFQLNVRK